jgi:hypothetical protein
MFHGHERYLTPGLLDDDVSYLELQQRILGIFADFPQVRLVYKEFVGGDHTYNPIPDYLRQKLPDALVIRDIPVVSLIWAVDGIICDYPGTALLQALLTSKPVLAYIDNRLFRTFPEAQALLRKRAWLADTADEFATQARMFLANGQPSGANLTNDEFLSAYGTYLNDGRSAERAADLIVGIVDSRQALRQRQQAGIP